MSKKYKKRPNKSVFFSSYHMIRHSNLHHHKTCHLTIQQMSRRFRHRQYHNHHHQGQKATFQNSYTPPICGIFYSLLFLSKDVN